MKMKKLLFILITMVAAIHLSPVAQAQQPCSANFQYFVNTTPNGTTILFNDSSFTLGTITNWNWTFNTGQVSTLENPVITVTGPTTIIACLTITAVYQNQTCTSTFCDSIFINGNPPPACNSVFTYTVGSQGVQFNGPAGNNTSWTWSFGDGTAGTGSNIFHNYGPGTYTVCLTVVNSSGVSCSTCQVITVPSSSGCQAYFTASPLQGTTIVNFTDMSQGNPTSWSWTFGDGGTSALQNPSHAYNGTGPFIICLTITDSIANCSDTYCDTVSLGWSPLCDSTFTYQTSPSATVFIASSQNAVSWTWDFGDGSTGTGGPTMTHSYANPGTYTACLTIVTANGMTCSSCQTVTIQSGSACSSNFAIYPDSITPHTYYAYNLATGAAPLTYTWSWGDGTSSTGAYPSHTYNGPGLYTICLTITDANGCTSNTCYQWQLLRLSSNAPVTINVIPGSVGLAEPAVINQVSVYPNPAHDQFSTSFTVSKETAISLRVINVAGQVVYDSPASIYYPGNHQVQLDATSMPQGLYMIEFQSAEFTTYKRVIIQ